jgi:hypothetical protein
MPRTNIVGADSHIRGERVRNIRRAPWECNSVPTIRTDDIDLPDMRTGNFELVREYYRKYNVAFLQWIVNSEISWKEE